MVRVIVNRAKCAGDAHRICVEICPAQVFHVKESGKPEVTHEENCILCRTCQVNCPCQAIEILT